jgi:hypothetical protein
MQRESRTRNTCEHQSSMVVPIAIPIAPSLQRRQDGSSRLVRMQASAVAGLLHLQNKGTYQILRRWLESKVALGHSTERDLDLTMERIFV